MGNDRRQNNGGGRYQHDMDERRCRSREHNCSERNKRKNRVWNVIQKAVGFALFFIGIILNLFMVSTIMSLDMLPKKYIIAIEITLGVFFIIFLILLLIKSTRWVAILLEVAMLIIIGLLLFVLITSKDILKDVSSASATTDTIVLYTKNDSSAEVLDYKDEPIGILKILDRENTNRSIVELEKVFGSKINVEEYNNVTELLAGLHNDEVAAILVNSAFLALAEDNADGQLVASEMQELWNKVIRRDLKFDNIIFAIQEAQTNKKGNVTQAKEQLEILTESETRSYSETETKTKEQSKIETELKTGTKIENDEVETTYQKPFVVYVSGNDSVGQLSTNGRSDVNILVVVNPNTGKILLVNTPRDYYVELAGKHELDKLTHAGIFGVDESMQTVSLLYETPIDYYVRLNFSGFMDIVDALGGITVYSDVDFTVAEWHYVEGRNDLSGIEALAFARERYSFESGDRQRGKNQQAVIKGLISKICSPAILTNYLDLMTAVKGTVETNMSVDEIAELVRLQIDEKIDWSIESISVNGSDANNYCYSLQSNKYVMIPDEKSVKNAKETIKKYLK